MDPLSALVASEEADVVIKRVNELSHVNRSIMALLRRGTCLGSFLDKLANLYVTQRLITANVTAARQAVATTEVFKAVHATMPDKTTEQVLNHVFGNTGSLAPSPISVEHTMGCVVANLGLC
jgi:hypothetical protein